MRKAALALGVVLGFGLVECSSSSTSSPGGQPPPPSPPALQPGEVCDTTNTTTPRLIVDPPSLVLGPNVTRPARVTAEPDLCAPASVTFATGDASVARAPSNATLDLRHPALDFTIAGGAMGSTSITATLKRADGSTAQATLPVVVEDPTVQACAQSDGTSGQIAEGTPSLNGGGSLADAYVSVNPPAFSRTDWLVLPTFTAQIACAGDLTASATPAGLVPISPAVTFSAGAPIVPNQSLRRDIDFAIPVNPAAIPPSGRMRHLRVLFQSPLASAPRVIPVASPRIESSANGYVLKFSSPWFGTYQAAFPADAGLRPGVRHLTHRAILGISMGAGGAAALGFRHHDQFDAIAPLGGFSDWTWFGWYIEHYALGGFCPVSQPNCPTYAPDAYPLPETYAHTIDWNHFWYEPGGGNGGTFARGEEIQVFEDIALMMGNPNGQNADPTLSFFAPGLGASDSFVAGNPMLPAGVMWSPLQPPGTDCRVTVEPVSGDPFQTSEQVWQQECQQSRCDPGSTWKAPTGYYDDEYNPDGSKQVISICDGNQMGVTPYVDTWAPPDPKTASPVDLALAVDLNGNGVRDENEPIIRSGHEPWQDVGVDGLADAQEPGYDANTNPDPNQDDYDFALNPNGTENNHHYDLGEPYLDVGLDGVAGTKQIAQGGYDYGEGDGVFSMADGLKNAMQVDSHNILHQWITSIPGGPMTDSEARRFRVWADGGVRDLVNFAAVANHLIGSIGSRRASDGSQLQSTAFYNNFGNLPGQDPTQPDVFDPTAMRWADLVDSPHLRYGTVDATATQIKLGDGQHVGTATQAIQRVQAGLYFLAQQWPDADRTVTEPTSNNPEASTTNTLCDPPTNADGTPTGQPADCTACEIGGQCTITSFKGPMTGRSGPFVVQLPPGYALQENVARNVRYPVIYVLHGYGQQPSDLQALAIVSTNFMNDPRHSAATRLAKFIIVYVDGRCRMPEGVDSNGNPVITGQAECIRGNFYMDSNRAAGAKVDSWFEEVVQAVDQNYRTMGPSDVDTVE